VSWYQSCERLLYAGAAHYACSVVDQILLLLEVGYVDYIGTYGRRGCSAKSRGEGFSGSFDIN
jgi:hypothetical protein